MGIFSARRVAAAATLAVISALTPLTFAPPAEAAGTPSQNDAIPVLPIVVSVAQVNGKPVRDDAWIDAQIAQAERLFGGIGIHLRKVKTQPLSDRFARLETRKDRDALAGELTSGVINVMIVDSLRDVDDPKLFRMGVHWRPQKDQKKHYVIVASSAWPTSMAHEIGHFFGNDHSKTVNNLMSYDRSGDEIFLNDTQAKTCRAFARIYLRSKELDPNLAAPPPMLGS
jgi:hypothetical protein